MLINFQFKLLVDNRPVEAAPAKAAIAASDVPATLPTPVSDVATAPEDGAAVAAPRPTTK